MLATASKKCIFDAMKKKRYQLNISLDADQKKRFDRYYKADGSHTLNISEFARQVLMTRVFKFESSEKINPHGGY